jgi:histidinol dehydrogenase
MERIDCRVADAGRLFAQLRERLSPRGDVVSPAGLERTIAAFGEPLAPTEVVERICTAVRDNGLPAVLDLTRKLDARSLDPAEIRVSESEIRAAYRSVEPVYLHTIERVRERIAAFQNTILHADIVYRDPPGITLEWRYRPLARVGICVPGGAAAYPSSLLMTAVPAQSAGVREIAVMVPPTKFGGYNPHVLAACHVLGLTEIYRIGGAQGVAALAYGVEGIHKVDKIVGPGNLFVALAKKHVFGEVDIDSIAGPSEVVVLADDSARPDWVAADLLSQAEHSPGSSVLISWHEPLIDAVQSSLNLQLQSLDRANLTRQSLEQFGALVLTRDEDEAVTLANQLAPEHIHLSTADPKRIAERITNAGAIFLGHDAPVAAGDYAAGPSHVLPTGGTARWASGLSANDFLKRTSLLSIEPDGLARLAPDIRILAEVETLTAHSASVDTRLQDNGRIHRER